MFRNVKILRKVTEHRGRGLETIQSTPLTKTYAASRSINHIYVPIYSFQNIFTANFPLASSWQQSCNVCWSVLLFLQ